MSFLIAHAESLAVLDAAASRQLASLEAISKPYPAGARFDLPSIADCAIVIERGWVALSYEAGHGRRQIVRIFLPGDIARMPGARFLSEDVALEAIEHTRLAFVPASRLDEMARRSRSLAEVLATLKVVEEFAAWRRIVSLGQFDANERVAELLCDCWMRGAARGLVEGGEMLFPLTQEEMGDATGLTAVHVNRTLRKLRVEGLATIRLHRLQVPHPGMLARRCGMDAVAASIVEMAETSRRLSGSLC
ncbi:hypothetical protein DMC47_34305 [Nostoc sp. 3335mG]|nr:hypothetical protein DMC47_34305 [Nostoc sp. 3335mG]